MSQVQTFTPARIVRQETVNGRLWCLIADSVDLRYWTPWTRGKLYPDKGGLEASVPAAELNRRLNSNERASYDANWQPD